MARAVCQRCNEGGRLLAPLGVNVLLELDAQFLCLVQCFALFAAFGGHVEPLLLARLRVDGDDERLMTLVPLNAGDAELVTARTNDDAPCGWLAECLFRLV